MNMANQARVTFLTETRGLDLITAHRAERTRQQVLRARPLLSRNFCK